MFGVTPHAIVPLADFGQLELGVQGVEHEVPFLSLVLGWSGGWAGQEGRERAQSPGEERELAARLVSEESGSPRQATMPMPRRGASTVCVSRCGVIFIVGLLSR